MKTSHFAIAAAVAGIALAAPAEAATVTDEFGVSLTVSDTCEITTIGDLAFGTATLISAAATASTTVGVTCTNAMDLNIGLDAGTTSGATTSQRLLTDATNTLNYNLYTSNAYSTVWGNTAGTDTVDTTATAGTEVTETIYGQVPAQTATAGSYSDQITVTITYADSE